MPLTSAAVRFWREIKIRNRMMTVWKGIVGVTPTKTPMAIPIAILRGFPFRLMNRS